MTTKISGNAGLNLIRNYDLVWMAKPIGEPFPLRDDIAGIPIPPTDNAAYRFIKLTAGDSYNDGALANESVTGTAPLIVATAVIDLAGSPLNSATVNLWNTERRTPRAGNAGTLEDDAIQNIKGHFTVKYGSDVAGDNALFNTSPGDNSDIVTYNGVNSSRQYWFDASKVVRADTETRVRNQGVTYYMRIL